MLDASNDELMETVSSCDYWMEALLWMDAPQDVKDRFWERFKGREKEHQRIKATKGNMMAKAENELSILNLALSLAARAKDTGKYDMGMASLLGIELIKIIDKGDHKTFSNMAKIIKAGGVKRGDIGGEGSNYGEYMKAFVLCHMKGDFPKLPTKKEIRDHLKIPQDADLRRDADKYLDALGLGGLPPS